MKIGNIRIAPLRHDSSYLNVKIDFSKLPFRLERRFGVGSDFQIAIDRYALRTISPYVPFDTGALEKSAHTNTVRGSGILEWGGESPAMKMNRASPGKYAVRQFYTNPGPGGKRGLRGKQWIDRWSNDGMGGLQSMINRLAGRL